MKVGSSILLLIVHLQTIQRSVGIFPRCSQYSGFAFQSRNCELCTGTSRCVYYIQNGFGNCIPLTQVLELGSSSAKRLPYAKDYSRAYRTAMEFIKSSSLPIYWHQGQCHQATFDLSYEGRAGAISSMDPTETINLVECKDDVFDCRYWALTGECIANPAGIHKICKKSCSICKSEPCEDKSPHCADWALIGECEKNPVWMGDNCKLACKFCMPEICEDRNEHCSEWASLGECNGTNWAYMMTSCALSCNTCQSEVIPTTTIPTTTTTTPATTTKPPPRQCFTCGTSFDRSGQFCDEKLTGTYIECKDTEDHCYFQYFLLPGKIFNFTMGCNEGRHPEGICQGTLIPTNDLSMVACTCDGKSCSLKLFCSQHSYLDKKLSVACINHPQISNVM